MTTDPGDLVLDPTCGSGTTAYVAENWGRRWITMDTSRVALALAHQRLMTAKFDYFELRPLNGALGKVDSRLKSALQAKLATKQKAEGKKAVTEADRRRWLLPPANRDPKAKLTLDADFAGWYEWEVPFDADADWPKDLQAALSDYRAAWRAKMDAVNAAIAANAENEELVDKPRVRKNVVRVSGPFTMEAVMPAELTLHGTSPIEGTEGELDGFDAGPVYDSPQNAEAFLDKMIRLLFADGVRFPNNKVAKFSRLSPIGEDFLHAEGEWGDGEGNTQTVAVSVGPEFGPVTAWQVENALTFAAAASRTLCLPASPSMQRRRP